MCLLGTINQNLPLQTSVIPSLHDVCTIFTTITVCQKVKRLCVMNVSVSKVCWTSAAPMIGSLLEKPCQIHFCV